MLTYYGNLFSRANPDPYRNSSPSNTQYTLGGFTDLDRRWVDRGNLYPSDLGDSHPGVVRLKTSPTLGVAAPGPNSLLSGRYGTFRKQCCSQREDPEDEEDEETEVNCVSDSKNFLNSLPTPQEYMDQLLDSEGACASAILHYLCNYYEVTIWHCPLVQCVWIGGLCYNCHAGQTGKICLCNPSTWWCEKFVFGSCRAAQAFYAVVEPQFGLHHPVAVVGQHSLVHGYLSGRCDDDSCEASGCLNDIDRNSPLAYTAGGEGDDTCGEGGRQPAPDDNAWTAATC